MSLILDALNRSRDDVDAVPNLATHHPVEPLPSGRRHYLPWAVLAVALVLIVWLVVERITAPPTPAEDIGAPVAELTQNIGSAAASVTTELKTRAASREKELQPTVSETTPKTTPKTTPTVATVAGSVEASEEEAVTPTPPGATDNAAGAMVASAVEASQAEAVIATPTPPGTTDNAAVARLYQNRDVSEDSELEASSVVADSPGAVRDEQPIDIEEVLQMAQEEAGNATLDEHPVPVLSSLSQRTKDDIPTLYYQRHDYSGDPSVSSVVLNGKTVRVGGSPLSGMKVDEILPDSVVLSYRGTQFRLRALNSWINL